MPIEILMPALSPTMKEGNLAKWHKKEGDTVSSGDVIAEIETDKATMEVEAVDEGELGKILVKEGTKGVKVNALIAVIKEDGDDKAAIDAFVTQHAANDDEGEVKEEKKPQEVPQAKTAKKPAPQKKISTSPAVASKRTIASPLAKRLAADNQVSLGQVKGSGPRGRIVKADVEQLLSQGIGATSITRNPDEFRSEPVSTMREVIAERLVESKQQVPHFYLTLDCIIDNLQKVREDINLMAPRDEADKPLYKVSVNDFVIKASALALRDVPEANASWNGNEIIYYNNIDVSVAVAIEGGLITPIIHNADQKMMVPLSSEMKSLAKRARENSLSPEEFQGGSFSISNLGMFGIKQFNAIINPPQSCILAIGSANERLKMGSSGVTAETVVEVTLSCDHRVVDGAIGAVLLERFKYYIEHPAAMLVQ